MRLAGNEDTPNAFRRTREFKRTVARRTRILFGPVRRFFRGALTQL